MLVNIFEIMIGLLFTNIIIFRNLKLKIALAISAKSMKSKKKQLNTRMVNQQLINTVEETSIPASFSHNNHN